MEEKIKQLCRKEGKLTAEDACFVLQLVQDHATPLLSLRGGSAPPQTSCQSQHTATASSPSSGPTRQGDAAAGVRGSSSSKHHKSAQKSRGSGCNSNVLLTEECPAQAKGAEASSLDLASLEDFPPMSVAMQDRRW